MATDTDIKQRIVERARDRFFRHGFSKVTMDDLAAELRMSKKTLYKQFASKEKLLWAIFEATTGDFKSSAEETYADDAMDFGDKLAEVGWKNTTVLSKWSKEFLQDIEKHAPHIWEKVEEFRRENIMNRFGAFYKRSVKAGYFRGDIDAQLVLTIYTYIIQGILNPEVLSQLPYSAEMVYEAITNILYEGMLTDAGRKKYQATKPRGGAKRRG